MTPEELESLREELEEYLPTSLQCKLDKLFEEIGKVPVDINIVDQLKTGINIRSARLNSFGTIIFEGFCTNKQSENFIDEMWKKNPGCTSVYVQNPKSSLLNRDKNYYRSILKPHKKAVIS